ncbi:hypothetical protein SDC9_98331 [bioreactor metagenome]|uniref:Uncharacterized protein n=1 Tax=bioreactor metagenome TaxID=1076179 RepID=A0A645AEF7_9ZZZZ
MPGLELGYLDGCSFPFLLEGTDNLWKAEQADHDRDELDVGHQVNIAETETGKGIHGVQADHGDQKAQDAADPSLQGVSLGRESATDHDAEDGEQKELPAGKLERHAGEKRGKGKHKDYTEQCTKHAGRGCKEDCMSSISTSCHGKPIQSSGCTGRGSGDVQQDC